MEKISRRRFVGGLVAAISLTGATKEPKPQVEEPKKECGLIDDLVEEMNKFDKKFPDQQIEYYITCNYTGLAFLNDTGNLEIEDHEPSRKQGSTHILWVPIDFPGASRGIGVTLMPKQFADVVLIAQYKTKSFSSRLVDTETLVSNRFFIVNRELEGRNAKIKMTLYEYSCPAAPERSQI